MSRDKGTRNLSCSTCEITDGSGFVEFPGVEGCSISGFPPKSRRKSLEASPGCALLEESASFELLSLSYRTTPLWNVRDRKAFGDKGKADEISSTGLRGLIGRHAAQQVGHSFRLIREVLAVSMDRLGEEAVKRYVFEI